MSADKIATEEAAGASGSQPRFLKWLPWEKTLIWGLFLLAIYTLRDFFFVIFMTFIVTYIMRGIVVRVTWLLTRKHHAPQLERGLALICFVLLMAGGYLAGSFLLPPLQRQIELLYGKASQFDPEREFETFGARTVGEYLYNQTYPDEEAEEYIRAYQKFLETSGDVRPSAYHAFVDFQAVIYGAFKDVDEKLREDLRKKAIAQYITNAESEGGGFEEWLTKKAQATYDADRDNQVARWEAQARSILGDAAFEKQKADENFEQLRDSRILRNLVNDLKNDAERYEAGRKEWKKQIETQADRAVLMADVAKSEEYLTRRRERLRELYEAKKKATPDDFPYEFERYLELQGAFDRAREAKEEAIFYAALGEEPDMTEDEREKQRREGFRLYAQKELWQAWWQSPGGFAAQVRETVNSYSQKGVQAATAWATGAIEKSFKVVTMASLALLLSLFICFDVPKLRKGVQKLRQSRVSGVYEEIAPGLINFGHLIGRAFQAQGVIAVFNTLLTFLAITFLEIDNEVFLCTIVFVCSFIPVLGVVLSSVPIAVIAIVQPGGSGLLALQITGAIIGIHFIETSFLNPKILGDMLHLHPVFVLAVLAVGQHFFGVWGLLLGVPVTVYIVRFVILNEGIPGFIEMPTTAIPAGAGPSSRAPPDGSSGQGSPVSAASTKAGASGAGKAGKRISGSSGDADSKAQKSEKQQTS